MEIVSIGKQEFQYSKDYLKIVSILHSPVGEEEGYYYFNKDEAIDVLKTVFTDKDEVDYLVESGLLFKPASKKFHCNYEGGLFIHSLIVGLELQNLTEKLDLHWKNPDSPLRVGLLHDFCKADDYILNDDPNAEPLWLNNPNSDYDGHGDKSILMLAGHVQLTDQEKLCIRYHMGSFTDSSEWKYYTRACQKEQNVLYTHVADMIASQVRGL